MFTWSIAKSAEAMFSRWAVKRICKFLLKKKLGQFILGDIDLNQLDVQLRAGTIQLTDLALNVDYINHKFGTAAVFVKEGSIGSLKVTMPWKDGGCRIEVDELEVVLAPRRVKVSEDKHESCSDTKKDHTSFSHISSNLENEVVKSDVTNVAVDVHEGVKTIAKMVKWLLTSFHVQIKKLIVAFDPLLEEENRKRLDQTLVLRIGEIECGTHISEDYSSSSSTKVHNFLGFSRLTNFMKFQGVVLELLHMDGLDHQSPPEVRAETTHVDWFSGHSSSGSMTTIVSGEKGGFSGSLKLIIPWKNGSLDICKVDADLNIEPLELRLQPSTIRCFIFLWGLFKDICEECEDHNHHGLPNSSLAPSPCTPPDKGILSNEGFTGNFCDMEKEPTNALLSESHVISDWVSKSQKDRNDEDPDFGASVDQFFECFDGLRNSQSALGNSGMWNWPCSVFSAITAASNLASGSLHVACEQQHVETNFNASISKISLLFSFTDEDQKKTSKIKNDEGDAAFHIRCVCAQLVDLLVVFQVCPREMKFESTVHHIQLIDHLYSENESVSLQTHGCNGNSKSEISLIQQMQDGVQSAIRTFKKSSKEGLDHCSGCSVDISLSNQDNDSCSHISNRNDFHSKDAGIKLLQTSGISQCHVTVNLGSSGGLYLGPTSFSIKLAPFVFWVNFDLISMMLDFLNEMASCIKQIAMDSGFVLKSESKRYGPSPLGDQGKISLQQGSVMTKKSLEGDIFFPHARIILCFPLRGHKDFSSYLCGKQFIAFDIVSSKIGGKEDQSAKPKPLETSNKRDVMAVSCSLNLYLGNLCLFYISSSFVNKSVGSGNYRQEPRFSVEKIASITKGTGHLPLICIFWQEGAITGPWIAKKAKLLACPAENARSKDNPDGKGFEFASVTTVKDVADFDTDCREEIRSSSAFFLHAQLPPIIIDLGKDQYENICGLLNQVIEHFACIVPDPVRTGEEESLSQTSFLVECCSITVSINIEPACDVKYSALEELPGSWHSLTLQVDNFELLSVSNIGGIKSANFLRVSHGQGGLWGSITNGLQREFLLISCDDSTMGRGNGEGSNVLSSKHSGSEIINLWDPESSHNFTSITVRSATFIAIGGRLDWFNTIFCFFSLPSSEPDQAGNKSLDEIRGSSFVLNLVDAGLNYEPYFKKLMAGESSNFISSSEMNASEAIGELYVSCVLAASSLKLFNASADDCTAGEHKIRLQDLGLLLCTVSESKLVSGTYSAEHLRKTGYVKVAHEAHVEALLRTNCENGHAWELECDESHIVLNTCHDTTLGLVRLAAQLQKLFAPDMQEHLVHLENRWINAQQVHENMFERTLGNESPPSVSHTQTSGLDNRPKTVNLMDEICEEVFQLDVNSAGQAKFFEPHFRLLSNNISFGEQCFGVPEHLSADLPHTRNPSALGVRTSMATSLDEKIPELIEEYFLSDLRPLSELTLKSQSSDMFYCKSGAVGVARTGNCGWYEDTSLRILENHASKVNVRSNVQKLVEIEASSSDSNDGDVGKAEGCIIFKNMNVVWRMTGGSDWYNFQNISRPSATLTSGRDATICFELTLSGIGFDYKFYPDGKISASRLSLTVHDICLNDKSDHAPWKLVLGYYRSKKHPRKSSSKAVKLNLDAVKPDPSIPLEENRLRIALLPMRLHLHQSQLDFLINFFGNNNSSSEPSPSTPSVSDKAGEQPEKSGNLPGTAISVKAFLPYFQKFDICPFLIRVDYSPCHVDLTALSGGKYVELVNLVPWKDVELQLKHVQGAGLYGWNSVCETILGEWLEDISKNQIHKLLKGLPPIKSLVAVGSGAAKLVSLPVKSYRKDHRLIKGMQRGTIAFLRSVSLEAIGLGVHLAAGAHNILLQAEDILTSIPPSVPWQVESRVATTVRSNQPKDAQQGIHQACQSITDGLGKSASALVQTPLKKLQRGAGVGSALATAVQATPAAAIAPASAAAHAVHCVLLGSRNSLDPEHKIESLEKYLGRAPPRESMQ